MKDLISKKYKALLYRDELRDTFLLLKYGEIYRYNKNKIRILTWSQPKAALMQKMGANLIEYYDGDKLYLLEAKTSKLDDFIALGRFRRRPHKNGNFIKKAEQRLAHEIHRYKPELAEV